MNFRKTVKRGALALMRGSGLSALVENSRWRSQRLAILCYHSLARDDEHEWDPALFMTSEQFEARLRWLSAREYNVIPLGEALNRLQGGSLPSRAVAITFDDGTADFLDLAWPLLERYRMPATVYWTTFYSEVSWPVFGMMCDYLLWKAREQTVSASLWLAQGTRSLRNLADRKLALEEIHQFVKREALNLPQRQVWMGDLAAHLQIDYATILARRSLQVMTPQEASLVAARGADVQLHTHRHRTPVDEALFLREIEDNRSRILSATGQRAEHFCYPSGKMAAEFFPWLKSLGVRSAVTCESGLAALDSNPYLLPRIVDTSTLNETEFEAWLSGARLLLGGSRRAGEIIGETPTGV